MLAEVLQRQHPKHIVRYHEHDLLLENVADEEMTEEEKKLAWKSYEEEKEAASRGFRECLRNYTKYIFIFFLFFINLFQMECFLNV